MQPDVEVLRAAEKQAGAFSRAQALALGISVRAMSRRVRRGNWSPLHPGVFRATGAAPGWAQACFAAALWAGEGSAIAGLSAARLWGLDLPTSVARSNTIHIDLPNAWWRGQGVPSLKNVRVYRRLALAPMDLTVRNGVRCTTLARTLVDLAGVLGALQLEVALDSARRLHNGAIVGVLDLLARLGTRGRKGAGVLKRLALDRQHFHQDSALEVRFLRSMRRAGMNPQCNVRVSAEGKLVGVVDFLFEAQKLIVQLHGYAFHSDRIQWERDQAQSRALQRLGYRVLPFTARDLKKPAGCLDVLRSFLAKRPS